MSKTEVTLIDKLKEKVATFPDTPGVYLMKDAREKVIYIGKAKSLKSRVRSYFNQNYEHSYKTRFLVGHIDQIEYILTKTEVEAFLLEASLIKKFRPRYNIRLKDDKAYPYIRVSAVDEFPRFYLARKVKHDGAVYFGPYTSAGYVRETLRFLNMTFKIRDCADSFMRARTRPCMTHQIGRCKAPCVNLVSREEYRNDIEMALEFLKGRDKKIVQGLTVQMKSAAKAERFENAARTRDALKAVQSILQKQTIVSTQDKNQDIVAFVGDERGTLIETVHVRSGRVIGNRSHFLPRLNFSATDEDVREWLTSFLNQYYLENVVPDEIVLQVDLGSDIIKLLQAVFKERQDECPRIAVATGTESKKLLEMTMTNAKAHFEDQVAKKESLKKGLDEIQVRLGLPRLPSRMECYDISNFQGAESVASQAVFEDGLPKKEDYRHYKIRTVEGPNDFASMKEVLSRRLRHVEYDDPDLIVIDGGKGQLKMATEVLKELARTDIPVVGMAKARTQGDFTDSEVTASEERFFIPGRQNPVTFALHSEAYQILVALRDEAHRFAITFHRSLREKRTLESELDQISGLGDKKKKALLKHFGTLEALRDANVEDIMQLKGFHRLLAERILLILKEGSSTEIIEDDEIS
jgi:excinuclease ABC subunit C